MKVDKLDLKLKIELKFNLGSILINILSFNAWIKFLVVPLVPGGDFRVRMDF